MGGTLAIILATAGSGYYVGYVKWERRSAEVSGGLVIDLSPPPANHPLFTKVTVTNGNPDEQLSGRHRIACNLVLAVGNAGTSFIAGGQGWVWQKPDSNLQIDASPDSAFRNIPELSTIQPNGDGITESCLHLVEFKSDTECEDLKLNFVYFLNEYPDRIQIKKLRSVATKNEAGAMEWHKQPYDATDSYCARFRQPSP